MAKYRKKKGQAGGAMVLHAVANNAFVIRPYELYARLRKSQRVLPWIALYKQDIVYLLKISAGEAGELITKIRKQEKGLTGRFITLQEFVKYTGANEDLAFRYLLSLTISQRILS